MTTDIPPTIETQALAALALDLQGSSPDCLKFFAALFASHDPILKVRRAFASEGVLESTLQSRFGRASLPSPKQYVDQAILVRLRGAAAAHPQWSFARLSAEFGASSPQSFGRFIRRVTGETSTEWLGQSTPEEELESFRASLILPYVETLRSFHPFDRSADRKPPLKRKTIERIRAGLEKYMGSKP